MSGIPQRGRRFRISTALSGIILAASCSQSPPSDLIPVTGRVHLDGQTLVSGSISFRPEARETWHQPTGSITAEGRYTIYTTSRAGAPPGRYRVVVFATEQSRSSEAHPGMPKSIIPKRYNDPQSTPLQVVVSADQMTGAYDLDLVTTTGPARRGPPKP